MGGKFCIDCAHYGEVLDYPGFDRCCLRPLSDRRDIVTGLQNDKLYSLCHNERRNNRTLFGRERCGPAGRFFEAK
jgi:hypothetical protein